MDRLSSFYDPRVIDGACGGSVHCLWLILEKIEDIVVGTSIPYNYEKSRF